MPIRLFVLINLLETPTQISLNRLSFKLYIIATKLINKNAYYCSACNGTEISKVTVPYAFKLLVQELMAINILTKIEPEINEFTTQN